MDVCEFERLGAVAHQKGSKVEDTTRLPLGPSEKNNAVAVARKPRTREVASRYKSGGSSTNVSTPAPRRCQSPNAGRTSPTPVASLPKRAVSADRKRPSTPTSRHSAASTPSSRPSTPSSPSSRSTTPVRDLVTEVHNDTRRPFGGRAPEGLWPSMRSLSSSFQSESISIPVGKRDRPTREPSPDRTLKSSTKVGSERKRTPLRGRNSLEQSENSRPVETNSQARLVDQHRWPSVITAKLSANSLSKSLDLTEKVGRSASLPVQTRGVSPRRTLVSDTLGRGVQQSISQVPGRVSSQGNGTVVHGVNPVANGPLHTRERASSLTRPSRTQSLPVPGFSRPSSPNKVLQSSSTNSRGLQSPSRTRPSTPISLSSVSNTSKGIQSPSRTRPSTPISLSSSTFSRPVVASSVLSYIGDTRKGKKNTNRIEDVHQLRLLHNRDLQWQFVNAQSDAVLVTQKITAENALHAVWNTTSELCDSVVLKRVSLQQLKQQMKLDEILNEQMAYLEEWSTAEREHSTSLSGAVEALKASTVRLPVTGGARADVRSVKNAVSSAVDVMQAMGSSICYLLAKVEGVNHLASELSDVAAIERSMLDECREILASTAAMQVQESSLRTHLIQLRQDFYSMK